MSLLLALSLSACSGDDDLTLFADTSDFAADGITIIELEAEVIFRGDPISDGKDVVFHCDSAQLFESRSDATAVVAGAMPQGESELEIDANGGVAKVFFLAPIIGGDISVKASYTTPNKDVISDDVVFSVGEPPLVASGRMNPTNPTAASTTAHFELSCEKAAVGAFLGNREDIEVGCAVMLRDGSGADLHHVPVSFYTEAGDMHEVVADKNGPREFYYRVSASPTVLPSDVAPVSAEEHYNLVDFGSGYIPAATEQNPRDGVVTILVVARGYEAFGDENGNGQYDAGEVFVDEGEPFLDVDDDGAFNSAIDPPHCCDTNANGRVDGPNGQWDENILIGRVFHIVWTGGVDRARSGISPDNWTVPFAGTEDFTIRVV
ncbi:hypothetical protein KAI87_16130, partial [Myxococcota bacterium]|nr:hypothetical protein [Myxococcota bacterium]